MCCPSHVCVYRCSRVKYMHGVVQPVSRASSSSRQTNATPVKQQLRIPPSPTPAAPQPPAATILLSVSDHLITPVTSQKWIHTGFVSFWLVYFTYNTLKVHPCWIFFRSKTQLIHHLLHEGFPGFLLLCPTPHPTQVITLFCVALRPLVLLYFWLLSKYFLNLLFLFNTMRFSWNQISFL